jgi:hypothetical protein
MCKVIPIFVPKIKLNPANNTDNIWNRAVYSESGVFNQFGHHFLLLSL